MPPSRLAFMVRAAFCIQKIIHVTIATASSESSSADDLLRFERERVGAEREDRADAESQRDGQTDAAHMPREHVAAADAA